MREQLVERVLRLDAHQEVGRAGSHSTPTVVLVHGAFADASGFAGVIRALQRDGVQARAQIAELQSQAQRSGGA
jgi:hypothetical protein